MARNPSNIDKDLDALYAELPHLDCKGHCFEECTVIPCSSRERDRAAEALGEPLIAPPPRLICSALNLLDHRCRIYEKRPLICRLWGLAEGMPCPHGCKPERVLTDKEAQEFIERALRIGGSPGDVYTQIDTAIGKGGRKLGRD